MVEDSASTVDDGARTERREDAAAGGRRSRSSPWPPLVAVGLAVSETGVFLGILPLAVAGLMGFGASVAGLLTASGYARRPGRPLLALGVLLGLGGLGVLAWTAPDGLSLLAWRAPARGTLLAWFGSDPIGARALAVAVAGAVLAAAGAVLGVAGGGATGVGPADE